MTTLQALLLALLQGITELFPVSSLGHAVIVPALLHWTLDEHGLTFLPFLVMLHLGTAVALFGFFWRDWFALIRGLLGRDEPQYVRESRHILMLIVVATLPAVVIGAALEHVLRSLFGTPEIASIFLFFNGIVLILGERLRSRRVGIPARPIAALTLKDALVVGIWQCAAFLPGISRSGATITGGLLRGIDHEGAARFSFLIALPLILAATLKQIMTLHHAHVPLTALEPAMWGALVAGIAAWLSTAILMRFFRNHDSWALGPFAIYSMAAGLISLLLLHFA